MINAKEAHAQADAVQAADAREREAKIEAQWAVWGPKVESAIESAVKQGCHSVEVDTNVSYTEQKDLEEMVAKRVKIHGYRTEFKWRDRNVYRLNIYW